MVSFYAITMYYHNEDPLCQMTNEILYRLKRSVPPYTEVGFNRINLTKENRLANELEIKHVPCFVYHGEKLFEARGDETPEEMEEICKTVITSVAFSGAR